MLANLMIFALVGVVLWGVNVIDRRWTKRLLAAERRRVVIELTEILMPVMLEQGGRASPLFQRLIATARISEEQ